MKSKEEEEEEEEEENRKDKREDLIGNYAQEKEAKSV